MLRKTILAVGAIVALASPLQAQAVDTLALIQEAQRRLQSGELTPEMILQQIEAAGLTLDDVRERLRQAGYPEDLLDQFLAGGVPGQLPSLTASQVENILRRLSIPATGLAPRDSLAALGLLSFEDTTGAALTTELPIFGRDIFRSASARFAPVTAGPVPSNYQLGPGDELVLILTGDVEEIYTLPVTREGFVIIPDVGRVPVNGLTLEQFKNALYGYLGRVYSGVMPGIEATTLFEVSISTLRQNQVYVIGEVARPSQYEVSSVSTVLDALYRAGGPGDNGSFRNVQVRRGSRVAATLDVYEYLVRGAASGDIPLRQGDVVFVPVRGRRVQLDGNVIRPGIYELKGGEGLRQLLELAGGIEPEADLSRIQIDRVLPPEQRIEGVSRSLIDIDVASLLDESEFVQLEAGDKVYVFAVPETRRNTVTVRGNVWSPGLYAYSAGMTLAELLQRAGGLKDDTYLGRAQVMRLDPRDLNRYVIPVALPADDSVRLAEYDEVVVYSVAELQEKRYVSIEGAVQNPGAFEFRDGMTVRDLVLLAGGLEDDAWIADAEIARQPDRPEPGRLAQIITVPIDSSYAVTGPVSRGPGGGSNGDVAAADFRLRRYDRVFIRRQPGREADRSVSITGQVNFPGEYGLKRKDERLSELIARAGGLTADAYEDGIRFFREHDVPGEGSRRARVNVDLPKLLEGNKPELDIMLADGDSIHIPEFVPTVLVEGAVLYPTTVMYREGAGMGYYIEGAGGWAQDADKGRARVEYANGTVKTSSSFLFFKSHPDPDPGSRVFVPARVSRPLDIGSYAAILSAVATIVVLATR